MNALPVAAIVLGLAALVWSADRFVDGAGAAARLLGVPPLLVGMVVVGFGTSAPELAVSTFAAVGGNASIALGNAFGSNTCNIALILGVCALLRPLPFGRAAIVREMPLLLVATLLAWFWLRDDALSRSEALLMLAAFAALLGVSSAAALRERRAAPAAGADGATAALRRPAAAAARLVAGLAGLVLSSKALVWGAVGIARALAPIRRSPAERRRTRSGGVWGTSSLPRASRRVLNRPARASQTANRAAYARIRATIAAP